MLFRIACEQVRRGATIEEFEKAARSDKDAAGHLDDHPDDKRAIKRAWEAAQKSLVTGGGDIENGRAFAARYAGKFIYLMDNNTWCHWTGTRWAKCERGEHIEAAKKLAEEAFDAATARFKLNSDVENANRLRAATALFRDKRRIEAMLALARAEPQIVCTLREFDQNQWLFGVSNGVVDLQSCELIKPHPQQKLMRASWARFDEHARCPKFEAFLERVLPTAEERAFLQRLVGYTMTGTAREELAVFLYGSGANGKSIFANILSALFGDYCVASSSDLVVKTKHDTEFKRELYRLKDSRLSLINEVAKGDIWDDKKLKDVASREPIATRALYEEGTHYSPTHVVWIRGNHMPDSHDVGEGFWRRLVPIHFAVQIPPDERIADLDQEIIRTELSGILNWALDGAADYQDFGLGTPVSIENVRQEYRARTDMLSRWLTECTVKDYASRTTRQDAFKAYERYCASNGAPSGGYKPFCSEMMRRGFKHRGKTGNAVKNFGELRLLEDPH